MDPTSIEKLLSDPEQVAEILARTLPDDRITLADVEARIAKLRSLDDPRFQIPPSPGADAPDTSDLQAKQDAAIGQHTLYKVTARHHRVEPYEADWSGKNCQAVRVTLPQSISEAQPIWTRLGVVKSSDHLIFSVDQVVQQYVSTFRVYPTVGRVDLITGARHLDLDRFAPISMFLAYENADDTVPSFYYLEAGSAQGSPEALYPAKDMRSSVHTEAGFAFTPFACARNWYTGGLEMDAAGTEPKAVVNSVAQVIDGTRHYLELCAEYVVDEPALVIPPLLAQIEASLRVFALAQGMDVELLPAEIQNLLGDCARRIYDWVIEPPKSGPADGYDGCPPTPG